MMSDLYLYLQEEFEMTEEQIEELTPAQLNYYIMNYMEFGFKG